MASLFAERRPARGKAAPLIRPARAPTLRRRKRPAAPGREEYA